MRAAIIIKLQRNLRMQPEQAPTQVSEGKSGKQLAKAADGSEAKAAASAAVLKRRRKNSKDDLSLLV